LTNKIKNNNQEIKRIENILYSKDRKAPKHNLMSDTGRDSVKSNALASNQKHIQAFAKKVRELEQKKYGNRKCS
jgi:dynactin complex subunit